MSDNKFAENKSMSASNVARATEKIRASVDSDHLREAAVNSEEIIRMLSSMWADMGMTPEQCIFALALATVNYRETVPEQYGGKEMFDRVAHEAQKYYHANKQ